MLWIDRKLFNMELLDVSSEIAKAFGSIELTPNTFVIDQKGNVIV